MTSSTVAGIDLMELAEIVDDAIDAWHDEVMLHEWLGWSWEEYQAWVADRTAIPRVPKHFARALRARASLIEEERS